jgi:hypothetical protein
LNDRKVIEHVYEKVMGSSETGSNAGSPTGEHHHHSASGQQAAGGRTNNNNSSCSQVMNVFCLTLSLPSMSSD